MHQIAFNQVHKDFIKPVCERNVCCYRVTLVYHDSCLSECLFISITNVPTCLHRPDKDANFKCHNTVFNVRSRHAIKHDFAYTDLIVSTSRAVFWCEILLTG